ncbi:MAG: beta-galactosidase, partial [Victivallales bacterium]|nr:beta-galactosidase [Victivallales bacterium]
MKDKNHPFLWGVQYYRAPTPAEECWERDIEKIKNIGFNSIKFWVQWRWSHRSPELCEFDDLDQLMDLAQKYELMVTLNIIMDVAPQWLYEKYPDAKMIMNDGTVVEPIAAQHRQIGGHPGPCYNHPGANAEKERFLHMALRHFKDHPALSMWDVWNEPELCFPQRFPVNTEKLACYCSNCQAEFRLWLQNKYHSIEHLNKVWGRCYTAWREVEAPRNETTINDFVDWREFHSHSMTKDANTRLRLAKEYSPDKINYLHVVPNDLSVWNPVSCCSDDFDLAKNCDVFASTMAGSDYVPQLVLSAGHGKVCYNVESHINCGNITMHQREVDLKTLNKDFLPQLGMGIKGFLFWQYRPESLGAESPAWGVVNPDGSDREITRAIKNFAEKILPLKDKLMHTFPLEAEIGIWKSRGNELFHYCGDNLKAVYESLSNYSEALYWNNYRYRFINSDILERQELENIKVLIMPCPYFLSAKEAESLKSWVAEGGILLSDAHLGGYDASAGRHSQTIPGHGIAELWNLRETMSCSSYHLHSKSATSYSELKIDNDDLRKALQRSDVTGDQYFPVLFEDNSIIWGAQRYAELSGNIVPLGYSGSESPCIASASSGKGTVFYCGSNFGQGAEKDKSGLNTLIRKVMNFAGIRTTLNARVV